MNMGGGVPAYGAVDSIFGSRRAARADRESPSLCQGCRSEFVALVVNAAAAGIVVGIALGVVAVINSQKQFFSLNYEPEPSYWVQARDGNIKVCGVNISKGNDNLTRVFPFELVNCMLQTIHAESVLEGQADGEHVGMVNTLIKYIPLCIAVAYGISFASFFLGRRFAPARGVTAPPHWRPEVSNGCEDEVEEILFEFDEGDTDDSSQIYLEKGSPPSEMHTCSEKETPFVTPYSPRMSRKNSGNLGSPVAAASSEQTSRSSVISAESGQISHRQSGSSRFISDMNAVPLRPLQESRGGGEEEDTVPRHKIKKATDNDLNDCVGRAAQPPRREMIVAELKKYGFEESQADQLYFAYIDAKANGTSVCRMYSIYDKPEELFIADVRAFLLYQGNVEKIQKKDITKNGDHHKRAIAFLAGQTVSNLMRNIVRARVVNNNLDSLESRVLSAKVEVILWDWINEVKSANKTGMTDVVARMARVAMGKFFNRSTPVTARRAEELPLREEV